MPRLPAEYATWMGRLWTPDDIKQRYCVDSVLFVDEVSIFGLKISLPFFVTFLAILLMRLRNETHSHAKPQQWFGVASFLIGNCFSVFLFFSLVSKLFYCYTI